MENNDFEKIRKNSSFVSRHFFNKRVDFPFNYGDIHQEEVEALIKSIEIIKSGEYSKPYLKQNRLFDHAPAFWKDLYWLEYYENGKNTTKASFEKQQTDFENNPDKDDILLNYQFDEVKTFKKKNIQEIETIIKLTKEFRTLINEAFPDLENEFARLLKEHNDLQESEAAKDKARNEERERLRNARKITIPRLQTNLTTDKRAKLFDELAKGGFIPDENLDCFNWAIGVTDETEPTQPGQWQPIEWKQAKQLLRELLEAIKSDEIIKAEMERKAPALFSHKGKSFGELPKNKVTETQLHKRLTKILTTVLNS